MSERLALDDAAADLSLLAHVRSMALEGTASLWNAMAGRLRKSPIECLGWLGRALAMETMDMASLRARAPDFEVWPYALAVDSKCLVTQAADDGGPVVCITANPFDLAAQSRVEARLTTVPLWVIAVPDDLVAFLLQAEDQLRAMDGALPALERGSALGPVLGDLSLSSITQDASPVVRLVHSTLFDALKLGASDIHLEGGASGLVVKYRIDGVLSQAAQLPPGEVMEQVVSRVKVMAELDISERRVPQDGRFKLAVKGREIDFRVSIMPSLFGEDVVIRVLDRRSLSDQALGLRLDHLGFSDKILQQIRALASEPYGMVLVTGPTGSGKTTTLYAALAEIHTGHDKIITIEDPVEYQLPGILQIPVNEKKGLSFARGLRSILRHDPDKILVGEIRDADTAQIAIQSALTGHLVFTSVHANNVFDVLGRFTHMNVDAYSFVSALNGVLAQRLLRVVCQECCVRVEPSQTELAAFAGYASALRDGAFVRGSGCGHCRGTGYKGRRAVGELLRINDELRELIVAKAPIRTIKEVARANGTELMRDAAFQLAVDGVTTLEEVARVTYSD